MGNGLGDRAIVRQESSRWPGMIEKRMRESDGGSERRTTKGGESRDGDNRRGRQAGTSDPELIEHKIGPAAAPCSLTDFMSKKCQYPHC